MQEKSPANKKKNANFKVPLLC